MTRVPSAPTASSSARITATGPPHTQPILRAQRGVDDHDHPLAYSERHTILRVAVLDPHPFVRLVRNRTVSERRLDLVVSHVVPNAFLPVGDIRLPYSSLMLHKA